METTEELGSVRQISENHMNQRKMAMVYSKNQFKTALRAKEVGQQLIVYTVLAKDSGPLLSTHMAAQDHPQLQFQEI